MTFLSIPRQTKTEEQMRWTGLFVFTFIWLLVAGCRDDLGYMEPTPTPTRVVEKPQVISTSPDAVVESWEYLSPRSEKVLESFPAGDPEAIEFAPGNRQAYIIWREGGFDLVWGGYFCSIQPILTIGQGMIELWENIAIWDDCDAMETIHAFKVELEADLPPEAWRYAIHEGAPTNGTTEERGRTVTGTTLLAVDDYPPRDTPYLVESGDFWLAHNPEGNLLAFVPVSPAYREDVTVETCRFDWVESIGRFVDPCSGDEWELDGTLNLAQSTERWSNRDLDRYAITLQEGAYSVHLDQVIMGTALPAQEP